MATGRQRRSSDSGNAPQVSFTVALASLDPTGPAPLAGYMDRPDGCAQVHSSLEANLVALFEDDRPAAVLISLDALFVGERITHAVLDALRLHGVAEAQAVIVASHTHYAPALEAEKPLLGKASPEHLAQVEQRLRDAIHSLMTAPRASCRAKVGVARADHAINRRRRWPLPRVSRRGLVFDKVVMAPESNGPTAEDITAILLEGEGQRAVLWHYACHPVGFPEPGTISADFPGVVRARLREKLGSDTGVVFLQGFCGDLRPRTAAKPPRLGELAMTVLRGPSFRPFESEEWRVWSDGLSRCALNALESARPQAFSPSAAAVRKAPLSDLLVGAPASRSIVLQRLDLLGLRTLVTLSAEPLIELAELAGGPDVLLVGYSRDVFGYWPRTRQLAEGGYEVNRFKRPFGCVFPWVADPDRVLSEMLNGLDENS